MTTNIYLGYSLDATQFRPSWTAHFYCSLERSTVTLWIKAGLHDGLSIISTAAGMKKSGTDHFHGYGLFGEERSLED